MGNKNVRKLFPGGNTTKGFFSYFEYIIEENANRYFILKGGPGVGKSNFMREIAKEMLKRGFSIEEFYCSSANDSLDAVKIVELEVALVDGSSPHIIDPNNPGAFDEIINLGDFWDEERLVKTKEESRLASKEASKCFKRAYRYLKALEQFREDIEKINEEGFDKYKFFNLQEILFRDIFKYVVKKERVGKTRHLFGSAITPRGHIDYSETTIGVMDKIYYIKGDWGTSFSNLLEDIAKRAVQLGYDVEIFHSPFHPVSIEDIIIPGLNLALTTKEKFRTKSNYVVDLDSLVSTRVKDKYKDELKFSKDMFDKLLEVAIAHINKAKEAHDKLESFYIPAMDFESINKKRQEVINRILKYQYN